MNFFQIADNESVALEARILALEMQCRSKDAELDAERAAGVQMRNALGVKIY